jgi:hypothetical protein
MSISSSVLSFFRLDFKDQAEKEVEKRNTITGRETAAKYSRGNIPIQHGMFTTKDDLERERKELESAHFD